MDWSNAFKNKLRQMPAQQKATPAAPVAAQPYVNNNKVSMFDNPRSSKGEFAADNYSNDFPKPWSYAPDAPNMAQYVNPKTGKMRKQFRVGQNDDLWLQMRNEKIDKELGQNRDMVAADSMNQYNSGVNRLGMTGGVDAGSRERLARQSQRSQMGNLQSAANTAGMSRSNAAMQHAGMLQDSERMNVGNALGALGRQDQWNQGLYTDTMGWQAAERMANAFGGGGGGSGDNSTFMGQDTGMGGDVHLGDPTKIGSNSTRGAPDVSGVSFGGQKLPDWMTNIKMNTGGGSGGTWGNVQRKANPSNWSW